LEFIDLLGYVDVRQPQKILPFYELKQLQPVWLTQDLQIYEEKENVERVQQYAVGGIRLVPVGRRSPNLKFEHENFPRRVLFEMTSICNTRCKMCPQTNLKRKPIHMDADKYMKILDELDSYGLEGIWIYHFGESLTHPKFKKIVDCVGMKKNLGFIWLSTNGILLDENMQDFLLSSNISYINFSLQSINVDNYNKIAPSSPARKIFSNLESFIGKKKEQKLKKPYFRLQIIEQKWTRHEIDPYLQEYFDKCDLISVNMLEHTDIAFNQLGKTLRRHKEKVKCTRVCRKDCFINSDGTVAICDNAYNNELDIGNVWDKSVYEIWNGTDRKKLLVMNENGALWKMPLCSTCTDYDL
jgi:radical SAM protein with 4Fe4S-binding SPASM domain